MNTTSMPAALAALASQLGVTPQGGEQASRLTLQVDNYRRVSAQTIERGVVALEVLLLALPSAQREREALIERAMQQVGAVARRWPATLALSADGRQLLLQATWRAEAGDALDQALEALLNQADRWSALLGAVV